MSNDAKPWQPPLFNKQWEVYHDRHKILLVDGTRWAGKSIAILHKVIRHLWETPAANFAIFAKSVKLAKDGGAWQILLEKILPLWLDAHIVGRDGQPLEILTKTAEGFPGPKVDANTRTAYFDVRNYYGGRSRCLLFSINNENEIEEKVKNKEFSGMWFIELSNWKDRRILAITVNALRMTGIHDAEKYLQWIADTNPDITLGRKSWIYQVFYQERNKPPTPDQTDDEQAMITELYAQMHTIQMHWKHNPYMTRPQQVRLYGICRGDKALMESYYNGDWGDGGFESKYHFRHIYLPSQHIVGGGTGEGDQIDVSPNSPSLYGGWDTGQVNHAWVALDKFFRQGPDGRQVPCWSVLDEAVHIGQGLSHDEHIRLEEFTASVLEKMQHIHEKNGKSFEWRHWSDESAIVVYRPGSENAYDYLEILQASKRWIAARSGTKIEPIWLQGVHKPSHSRKARIRMLAQLLRENRLFISSRCERVPEMLLNLSQTDAQYIVKNLYVHTFDALTYPIFAEMHQELLEDAFTPVATSRDQPETRSIISV